MKTHAQRRSTLKGTMYDRRVLQVTPQGQRLCGSQYLIGLPPCISIIVVIRWLRRHADGVIGGLAVSRL